MRQRDGETVYVVAKFTGSFDAEGQLTELKGYSSTKPAGSGSSSS